MKTLLIQLDRLSLQAPLDQSAETLALTSLVLPRPGIQRKTALKPFRLQKGHASLARKAFHENALLKEKVDGAFALTLQLTQPVTHRELQNWLRSLAGLGLEAAGNLLASGLSMSALRPLLRAPFDQLADQLSEDSPDFMLEGGIEWDSETLSPGRIAIPLKLTQRIRQSDLPPGPKARDKRKTSAKTYKKGLTVGEAVFKVQVG